MSVEVFRVALVALAGLSIASGNFTRHARAATLVYTNDVMGDLEPCGCRTNPHGGMVRKANLLKKLADKSILQLDAGDLLFSTDRYPAGLAAQAEIQAEFLLKSMALTGHDAVVPGEKDFALGTATLRKLATHGKVLFLAANLKPRKGGKLFEASRIFVKKRTDGSPIRVAVLGLVGPKLSWPSDLKAEDPVTVARREVPKLREKADLVILLTHQGMDEDVALAKAVKGVDVIVGAHSQSFLQTPRTVNGAKIYQSSFRNQYVGVVPLETPFEGKGHELTGLDAGYDDAPGAPGAPGTASEMATLVAEFKKAVADANTKEEAIITRLESSSEARKYQTFPKCAECHLKQFDFWRKTSHADALRPLIEKGQEKNKECLSCHTVGLGEKEGFDSVLALAEIRTQVTEDGEESERIEILPLEDLDPFLKAMHSAKSLKNTVKLKREDPQGQPLRDTLHRLNRSWTPVQCENCHQPGRDHPFSTGYAKQVSIDRCLTCHTPQQAPEWYTKPEGGKPAQRDLPKIEAKKAKIQCPAGDLGDDEL